LVQREKLAIKEELQVIEEEVEALLLLIKGKLGFWFEIC